MKGDNWIDARTACALLGVKPQTLYAYVGRRGLRAQADPDDARASLYSRRDVERLLKQTRRPRAREDVAQAAIRWGDPVLVTSISEVRDGSLRLRGRAIEDCAQALSLEETAALLCGVERVDCPDTPAPASRGSIFSRAIRALAAETEASPPIIDLDAPQTAGQTGRMMAIIANACLGRSLDGPTHARVARAWGLDAQGKEIVRQALVLSSDHELNPSTFAVRVCASTGADLASALLAGMATLSGVRHGGVAAMASLGLEAQLEGAFDAFLAEHAAAGPYAFGFGHPLYPEGDPRAIHLLGLLPEATAERAAIQRIADRLSLEPNIDAALAAACRHLGCPDGAATSIFAIGRAAGWAAHAIEQARSGSIIRPRAKFEPAPPPPA